MSEEPSEEKQLPATARKLRKAREKGQVVTSKEAVSSVTGIAALLYLYLQRGMLKEKLMALWQLAPPDGADFWLMLQAKTAILWQLTLQLALPLTGLVIAVSVLFGMAVSGGPVFSVQPLTPDFSKLNPASGLKRLFGRKAMLTYVMHLLRLALLSVAFGLILIGGWGAMMRAPVCGLGCAAETLEGVLQPMLIAAVALMAAMAGFDFLVSRSSFLHDQKMTQTEFKRELKDQMGDPQMRSHLRRERRQMVTAPTGARQATLVVTGAGGAVGIRYVEGETPAPLVVARARGRPAMRRLDRAADAFAADDATLAAMLSGISVGSYVTEDDAILRLAPLIQQAALQRQT